MNLEIRNPELGRPINAETQTRHLQGADEPLEQALDALNEKSPTPASTSEEDMEDCSFPAEVESGLQPQPSAGHPVDLNEAPTTRYWPEG